MELTVKESAKALQSKLMKLEETGPTALGPAVATSIGMAAEGAAGSQVVICTDGLANIGVGAFDEAKTETDFGKVEQFYEQVGQYAKTEGITVNIVSITGDECKLELDYRSHYDTSCLRRGIQRLAESKLRDEGRGKAAKGM